HAVDAAALSLVGSGNTTGRIGEPVESAYALTNSGTTDLGAHMPPPAGENVRGRFTITGPVPLTGASVPGCGDESCTSPDVAVEFFNPVTGSFQRIYNLQSDGSGGLVAHFGALAVGGIPVPAGFSGSFLFRTTLLNHTGTYTVQSQVVGIESGKVYAQAAPHTIAIGTGAAASIELVGGDAGEAVVGGHACDQGGLGVGGRDAGGNAVPVVAEAHNGHAGATGDGAGSAAPALTDADGLTSVSLSSNTIAGEFTVTAGSGIGAGQSVGFVLRNVAGDASQLHLVSGSGQTAALNLPFALPLVVRVTDA